MEAASVSVKKPFETIRSNNSPPDFLQDVTSHSKKILLTTPLSYIFCLDFHIPPEGLQYSDDSTKNHVKEIRICWRTLLSISISIWTLSFSLEFIKVLSMILAARLTVVTLLVTSITEEKFPLNNSKLEQFPNLLRNENYPNSVQK